LMNRVAIESCPSPNHDQRARGPVDILLLHYTGMPDADQSLAWLCNRDSKVSSHYFVFDDGRVLSLVPEERRAWHAGASRWAGDTDINSRSIGIEIANPGHPGGLPDYSDVQIEALITLCRDIVGRHSIRPHRVLAHSDVAPGRKLDPGERFPWARLAAHGVGHWVDPIAIADGPNCTSGDRNGAVETLQSLLALYGYGIDITGEYEARTEAVVTAFQRHFRPERVDGIADRSTVETLRNLIVSLP
jgi:N-acetylmuramoyl-L-alanine amidase